MLRQLQLWDADGSEHGWSVRQSARARRLSVRVFRNGGVEIVVPPRTSPQRVSAFVSEHREWIERQRRRALPRGRLAAAAARPVADGDRRAVALHARCGCRPGAPARAARVRAAAQRPAGRIARGCGACWCSWLVEHAAAALRGAAARAGGADGGGARAPAGALPALALGQLFAPSHHQPERVPAVSAPRGAALPDDPRAGAPAAHESFGALLGRGGALRAGLEGAGSRAAAGLARVPSWMFR